MSITAASSTKREKAIEACSYQIAHLGRRRARVVSPDYGEGASLIGDVTLTDVR